MVKLDQRRVVVAAAAARAAAKHETRRVIVRNRLEPVARVAHRGQPREALRGVDDCGKSNRSGFVRCELEANNQNGKEIL